MASERTKFGDLPGRRLELAVVCQKCGHESVLDGTAPALRNRPIAGQRFRCSVERNGVACRGIGLPTLRTRTDWTPPPQPPLPPILSPPPSGVAGTEARSPDSDTPFVEEAPAARTGDEGR